MSTIFECKQAKIVLNNIKELIDWWNECSDLMVYKLYNEYAWNYYDRHADDELANSLEVIEKEIRNFFKDKTDE